MCSVLLIAPHNSYRIHAYIEAAQQLSINLVIASESQYSLVSAVSQGIRIDFTDDEASLRQIVSAHQTYRFQAVIASDDVAVRLAALVSETLGLLSNDAGAVQLTRRKDLAREVLHKASVPVPAFRVVNVSRPLDAQLAALTFPVVLKPVAMSGSRGVIRANDMKECLAALARIQPVIATAANPIEQSLVLIEAYISGTEVAFEGLLVNGQLKQLTIFDKPDVMEGPFFEETYYIAPSRLSAEEQSLVFQRVDAACKAYGLRQGPIHAELRLSKNEAYILEVAARTIGGDCANMLQLGFGKTIEELVLLQALNKTLDMPTLNGSVGVLMIPITSGGVLRRVEGVSDAKCVDYIVDVVLSVREGYELVPLPEGSSYLGFVFAKAPTAREVEAALRAAHQCLTVVTMPSLSVVT